MKNYQLSLPYLRLFIGTIFIFLGLASTISFLSQGFSGLAFVIVLLFCFGIEITKILLGGDVGFYLTMKQPDKAIFSGVIVLVLVGLSLTAEVYFLMSGHLTEQAQLSTVTERTAALQQQITAKQSQLAACNPSFVSKCVNPRTEELNALQSEYNKVFLSANEQATAMGNAKFYELLAKSTGTDKDNLILFFNFLRALLGEVLGLYLCSQYATYKRLQNYSETALDTPLAEPVPVGTVPPPVTFADVLREAMVENERLKNELAATKQLEEKKD